jgi:hypothetical protein
MQRFPFGRFVSVRIVGFRYNRTCLQRGGYETSILVLSIPSLCRELCTKSNPKPVRTVGAVYQGVNELE